ncbi:MAG: DUF4382 domain-containing protein [Bacteroides sp.]|jgi:hypothetical protein|nr:DUF4382 domain-containing protein [Bacteroides sp.]
MKKHSIIFLLAFLGISVFMFSSCQKDAERTKGTLHLSLTDAPIDEYDITGVFITFTGIEYNQGDEWHVLEGFEGPQTFNLLDLTDGVSAPLGIFDLEPGDYNQIRFMLDAPEEGNGNHPNPGCYLEFGGDPENTQPLFVPSGSQTGFKAIGGFTIPEAGDLYVTADFDVRKSVVVAGNSGKFILKPTIRLIVEDRAGNIDGTILNPAEDKDYVVYVYGDGLYEATEAAEPVDENPRFPNAISSDLVELVDEELKFFLGYLPAGLYDLVIVSQVDGIFEAVVGLVEDVQVIEQETTEVEIDLDTL